MVYGMDLICGQRWRSQACFLRLRLKFWMQNTFVPQRFWECLGYFFYPSASSSASLRKLESSFVRLYSTGTCSVHSCSPALWWGMRYFAIFHTLIYLSPPPCFCTSYSSFNFKIFRYISCLLWHHLSKKLFKCQRIHLCTVFGKKMEPFSS